jgi:hypothetical protein
MTDSGFGSSSFSVATTVFVSLAICAVISYGVFYYFKQRLSVIEQSQMEQARVMQAFIARSIMHQHGNPMNQMNHMNQMNQMNQMNHVQEHPVHKEVNITESGLIEVSSDSESESDDSESESTTSESSSDYDNESGSESESESETTKHIQIQLSSLSSDDAVVADVIADIVADAGSSDKKIISLNKTALGNTDAESESESDSGDEHSCDHEDLQDTSFELKIGYKNKDAKDAKDAKDSKIHLNYGNMSVPALRQLAKERGLGGEDADLHKLKKKDLMQLLQ